MKQITQDLNEKISLKRITKQDLEILKKWRNDKEIWENNTQFTLLNIKNQIKWFSEITKKDTNRKMFLIKYNQKSIGVCGLIHFDKLEKSADIAIIIGEKNFQKKGIGKICLKKLLEIGFNKLKLHRIVAEVLEHNSNSMIFFKKMNFQNEGTLRENLWRNGKWNDTEIFSILKSDFIKN